MVTCIFPGPSPQHLFLQCLYLRKWELGGHPREVGELSVRHRAEIVF